LRSDVEVGTCLSGGIDSSVLAVLMAGETSHPVFCFTSIFKNQSFNEEAYSDIVAQKINGKHVKVEPTLEGFLKEADNLIYSQDVPIWSTSTYAQYKVMELAKQNKIKVVLDGQGADELFGGYHHHFVAKWNNLLSKGKFREAISEIKLSSKSIPHPFIFYAKQKLKQNFNVNRKDFDLILNRDFVRSAEMNNSALGFNELNEQLIHDIYDTRLKTFLKCEDRCGMWHSVESRTPFSDDIDLIQLVFSFNANRKIQKGVSKYLLREAVKAKLPEQIYSRYDKKGFETPMQDWMIKMRPQVLAEIKNAGFDFVNYNNLERGNANSVSQNAILFKLFILTRWFKVFSP
jgi:asparagine synthase (glutamine-hydrolysing)